MWIQISNWKLDGRETVRFDDGRQAPLYTLSWNAIQPRTWFMLMEWWIPLIVISRRRLIRVCEKFRSWRNPVPEPECCNGTHGWWTRSTRNPAPLPVLYRMHRVKTYHILSNQIGILQINAKILRMLKFDISGQLDIWLPPPYTLQQEIACPIT